MFCPKCEKEIKKPEIRISRWTGNKFCKHCGEKLTKLSGFSIASLILGIPFISGFLGSLPAVIFAIIALNKISKSKGKIAGRGIAILGLILGSLGIICVLLIVVIPRFVAFSQ